MRLLIAGCVALAAISLALPIGPGFDPWAWLVWGREALHFDLDTAGGPAWKPLPVLVTTVLSIFGGAAPALWLVVVRASAFLAVALAYRLGARLAGPVAGALAAVALALTPEFLADAARGTSEPILVALVLWAVERHLDGRRDHAFVLGVLAALVRPEAWPFLALYGLVLWRAEPDRRRELATLGLAVPLLWFGGDLVGSGEPFTGGERARTEGAPVGNALAASFEVVAAPVWLGALAAVALAGSARGAGGAGARRRAEGAALGQRWLGAGSRGEDVRTLQTLLTGLGFETAADGDYGPATEESVRGYERSRGLFVDGEVSRGQAEGIRRRARGGGGEGTTRLLAAGALAWIAVVVAMSALGYPGLARFMFPAAAALCVLAGVGAVRLVDAAPTPRGRLVPAGLILALALPFAVLGVGDLSTELAGAANRTDAEHELRDTAREAGGRDRLLGCGRLVLAGVPGQSVLAWELDVPLDEVEVNSPKLARQLEAGVAIVRERARAALEARAGEAGGDPPIVQPLASSGQWAAFAVGCAPES